MTFTPTRPIKFPMAAAYSAKGDSLVYYHVRARHSPRVLEEKKAGKSFV